MLDHIYNLEEKRRLVDQMLARANSFLAGQVGPIEAARSFRGFLDIDKQLDEILGTFVAVDSETGALPVGISYGPPHASTRSARDAINFEKKQLLERLPTGVLAVP